MSEQRIYEKAVEINTENTRTFYDKRAQQAAQMQCPYTAVLLGDQNPQHAAQWDQFEKGYILPKLQIEPTSQVLDIGCGMGRWAQSLIPLCGGYCGADFSGAMVQLAQEQCQFPGKDYSFVNLPFQQVRAQTLGKERFDRVIIGGVCMYINDADLACCYENLITLLDEHAVLYLTETVAVKTRLTLDDFPSEALKSNYDVIYRTPQEYNRYYQVLLNHGFRVVEQAYLPHLNDQAAYSETDRWYTIFKR